jgi:hypothetical protein
MLNRTLFLKFRAFSHPVFADNLHSFDLNPVTTAVLPYSSDPVISSSLHQATHPAALNYDPLHFFS